jgi:hypothetical protein
MSNNQNMSPQHSTKKFTAHFIQLNMHKSEVVAERLRQFIIRFNTSAQQDDTPLICLLQEPPYSGTRLTPPPPDYHEICLMPKEDEAKRCRAAMWIHNCLDPVLVAQLSHFDLASARVSLGKKIVLLSSIYIPHDPTNPDNPAIPQAMLSCFGALNSHQVLISGDLNSHSPAWNSTTLCGRGEFIESFASANNMHFL